MTKIKLVDGTIIVADSVKLDDGILKIATKEKTVEELADLFGNKENTNHIVLMTESGIESGFQTGFTSFAGIEYLDDVKTIKLFQPVDVTEARIANAEGTATQAMAEATELEATVDALLGLGVEVDE